jgi:class 3 adenylate cyclase
MWSAAMDVGEWLKGLGLGQYETAFREHAIDMDVLAELTDGELAQVGVPLGDRKRLLKAIASLSKTEPSPSSKEGAPPAQANPLTPGAGRDAERRPITVMFCDLVGSTSIAGKLDAEDWRSLVNAYLDEASKAVTGLGGHVLKRLGDGLMALFGYPQAQENDAERAVRAALAIQRALTEIDVRNASKGLPELSARIGIESGPVVVEATGEVFGDAPNVAARVQAGARALTPFVGREEELGMLARRGSAPRQARVSSCSSSANRGSASRGSSRSSARGSQRHPTPGSNGAPRNCSRTRRFIRLPNGADCDLVWMPLPSSASRILRTRCG